MPIWLICCRARMYKGKFKKWEIRKYRKRRLSLSRVVVEQDSSGASAQPEVNSFPPFCAPMPDPSRSVREPNGLSHHTGAPQTRQSHTASSSYKISQSFFEDSMQSDVNSAAPS